jgi:hypothetical protein
MTRSTRMTSPVRPRLRLEPLEDRLVPVTFTVTNTNDAGPGSLRDAIDLANEVTGADDIVFDPAVRGKTFNLTTFNNPQTGNFAGPSALLIFDDVTIHGTGETIARDNSVFAAFRLFQVTSTGKLTLENLTLSDGLALGGSGLSGGGGAVGLGGAIYNQGTLIISGSTLTENTAEGGTGGAGGFHSGRLGGGGLGGGATGADGGGPNGGVAGGSLPGFGGGGAGDSGGPFDQPQSGGFGGGGAGGFGTSRGGDGGFGAGGGGGSDTLSPGSGEFGGGEGSRSGGGGGGGTGMGGAIFNQGGDVLIRDSTITGNAAVGGAGGTGGGYPGTGFGGGVFNLNGDLTLTNVTIAGNTVAEGAVGDGGQSGEEPSGGALYSLGRAVEGALTKTVIATVTVANSILADSKFVYDHPFNGPDVVSNQDSVATAIRATGPNIVTTAADVDDGTFAGLAFTIADPVLKPLADNGGLTRTLALGPGSPARNAGDNAAAGGLTADQRGPGFARIADGVVDIGAFEVQPPVPPPPPPGVPAAVADFAAGADAGGGPVARLFGPGGAEQFSLTPFDASFTGGVRVAAGDFNGDGVPDLAVGTGPGIATSVRVFDGKTKAELFSVAPFEAAFTGGVFVAAGDLDGDGRADLIVTPDQGGGPRVRVFSGNGFGLVADFLGIDDPAFRGGARAAVGDVNGDVRGDLLVAAGFGGGPRLAVFDGKSVGSAPVKLVGDFFLFEPTLRNGVFVASGDLDGDGFADVVAGGGPGGGPRVLALSGKALLAGSQVQVANFFAGDVNNRGGVRVAVKDLGGDGRADLVVGSGSGAGSRVTGYLGKSIAADGTPPEQFGFDAFPGFTGGVFVG